MREIDTDCIKNTVKELYIKASYLIGPDILTALKGSLEKEESPTGKSVLEQIMKNHEIAAGEKIPICQDTGMAVLFIRLGQEVRLVGGDFTEAVNQGVREAYQEGFLRKSVVADPLFDRKNTKDNTPAVIYVDVAPGDKIHFQITAKGFGSENMSRLKVLTPADGEQGVKDFVVETVKIAGPNPCPPVIVGVGIGGTIDKAAQIAKKATLREIGRSNEDTRYARLEEEILEEINRSGIGPAGLGGRVTALAVNIDHYPTHIAGLPVVVNVCCHAARHAEAEI
ncbi:fumarate hydratase [Candidatus Formimonas warabiya]|uniref:Fumarate hydratase n=1 Tax=Formimonas warabiya TaxID=1761012 RepID=A0A3G1KSH3_FORW1|nr:fumarate hydratase [Candidatus Formimonas warabiya]ATW25409.1 fumarate hydratase [Candidatus Formimonas warabiya]